MGRLMTALAVFFFHWCHTVCCLLSAQYLSRVDIIHGSQSLIRVELHIDHLNHSN